MSVVSPGVVVRNGDEVQIDTLGGARGVVESIRRISTAEVVDFYEGLANDIVISVHIGDSFLNLRGSQVTFPEKAF